MKTTMIYIFGIVLLNFLCPAVGQIDGNYRENKKKAFEALSEVECQTSLEFCQGVLRVVPSHPEMNYLAARLNAFLGNEKTALEHLKKATMLGYTTKVPFNKVHHLNDSAFSKLRKEKGFVEILSTLAKYEMPIHKSRVAFTLSDKDLMPEGISYDPTGKMFYFGSETKNKIVRVDHLGNSSDFTEEKQDGLGSLRGIHIDSSRRVLWVCSESEITTGIFKYNLSTGKLINKYSLPRGDRGRSFNDLVIHQNGGVYITDVSGTIYSISPSSDELEIFLRDDRIVSPNGITLSEDGQVIYMADYPIGIYKIDIRTKSFSLLSHGDEYSSAEVDGLYFMNNNLYAIQTGLDIVSRFALSEDGASIQGREIYERNSSYLDWPTTGVIVDDHFYFIADTQGKGGELEGIIIMKFPR